MLGLKILTLNLKTEYWEAILKGEKTEEYRECKDYWKKRLEGKNYDLICLCKGYPRKNDCQRRMFRFWNGFTTKFIRHKQFGPCWTHVYAVDVSRVVY